MRKIPAVLSAFALTFGISCKSGKSGGDDEISTSNLGSKLFLGQLMSDDKEAGWVVQDNEGYVVIGATASEGGLDFTEVYSALKDGRKMFLTVDSNGLPQEISLSDGSKVTFSNFQDNTYDVTLVDAAGNIANAVNLDFSTYRDQSNTLALDGRANWDKFVGALSITIRIAVCPISVASTGGTLGASAVWAAASCTLAGKTLAQILNGNMEINATDQVPRFVISKICDPEILRDRSADNLGPCLAQLIERRDSGFVIVSTAVDDSKPLDGKKMIYKGGLEFQEIIVDGEVQPGQMLPSSPFAVVITAFGNEYKLADEHIKSLESLSSNSGMVHQSTEQKKLGDRSYQAKISYGLTAGGTLVFIQTFTLSEDLKRIDGVLGQHTTVPVAEEDRTVTTVFTYKYSGNLQE